LARGFELLAAEILFSYFLYFQINYFYSKKSENLFISTEKLNGGSRKCGDGVGGGELADGDGFGRREWK